MWFFKTWNRWWYSVVMMAAYVALFAYWKLMPGRVTFVVGALLVACGLGLALLVAVRRGYFAGRLDVLLHALVIADIFLEGFAFEAVLPFLDAAADAPQLAMRYHENNGFLLCSVLFALVLFTGHFCGLPAATRRSLRSIKTGA